MDIDTLKEGLRINKAALDDELVRQPFLFFDVAERLTEANAHRDALKEELARVDAEVAASVREDYAKAKVRATDATVLSEVMQDPKHQRASAKYLAAKRDADLMAALKDAFHQRGYMLRDLASLYVSSYFENNSVKGTSATDSAAYSQTRRRMAEQRRGRRQINNGD